MGRGLQASTETNEDSFSLTSTCQKTRHKLCPHTVQTDRSTEMDKLVSMFGEKIGDMVEDRVKSALGVDDEDEDEKKGGIFSVFGGDDKKKEKDKDEEKGGFFSKIFNKDDDDDKGKEKKSGFSGLFVEQGGAAGGETAGGGEESGGAGGQSIGVNDRDLFNDLMDVAEETSNKN